MSDIDDNDNNGDIGDNNDVVMMALMMMLMLMMEKMATFKKDEQKWQQRCLPAILHILQALQASILDFDLPGGRATLDFRLLMWWQLFRPNN